MVISEKILHPSPREVRLYKEGVFWIAYEQSAFVVSGVKTLKPTKKFVKKLGKEIVSVGFPASSLENVMTKFTLKERKDMMVVLEAAVACDETAYREWKERMPLAATKPKAVAVPLVAPQPLVATAPLERDERESAVIERLLSFDIGNSSPMQCFVFLNELKQSITKK